MIARPLLLQARRLSTCGGAAAGGQAKAKRNILDLSFEDLAGEMVTMGQPSYRTRQLWTYIYGKLGTSFDHVPSFPLGLKQQARGSARSGALRAYVALFPIFRMIQTNIPYYPTAAERAVCVGDGGQRRRRSGWKHKQRWHPQVGDVDIERCARMRACNIGC